MPTGLHHVREGEGPPLVLLAGIGSTGSAWKAMVPLLAREREVWRVDLPGFGWSAAFPSGEPCGIEALTDAAEEFFAEAGLERPPSRAIRSAARSGSSWAGATPSPP